MTHICVGNLNVIGSDNGLLPGQRQAITWTIVEILLIGPLETNFNEIFIRIITLVRHKKAWFDCKMHGSAQKNPGSTQKYPPQHASIDIAIVKHPPLPREKYFFPILLKYFVFKNP